MSNNSITTKINFLDYLKFNYYPITKKKNYKFILAFFIIVASLFLIYTIMYFIKQDFSAYSSLPFGSLAIVLLFLFVYFYSNYRKDYMGFAEELTYSFYDERMTITTKSKKGCFQVLVDSMLYTEIKDNSLFVVTKKEKYYMISLKKSSEEFKRFIIEWSEKTNKKIA